MKLTTRVCIVGAGPAGIVLGNILLDAGVGCVVIDRYDRQGIFDRGRAGVLESTTVAALAAHGLADTIYSQGHTHGSCEFRAPDFSWELDYSALADGDCHYIYPQNLLNDDLIGRYLDKGGHLVLGAEADACDFDDDGVVISGSTFRIRSELVAACDGFHGLMRRTLPAGAVATYEKQYPYRWLAILANAAPSARHVVYGLHPDGFGAHMPRTKDQSRYYLQVDAADTTEEWTDARIWKALATRLRKDDWTLNEGQIVHKSILDMRSYVMEPMQFGRVLYAGDAAHIITPSGGKGLNLAVHDAVALAKHMRRYFEEKLPVASFAAYTDERLPLIWRAQEFSRSMLNMLHRAPDGDPDSARFLNKISESKLKQLGSSRTFARDFARNYVGIQ